MFSLLCHIAGGLVLFLYGMRLTSDGLREAVGGRLKATLSVLTSRRITGVLAGVTVTFFLSSSSAVSVMLVELTNAGLLSLTQAIVVILGSTIGTALFLQVIAFNIASYAFLILVAGFVANLTFRYRRGKAIGTALIGLALVFLGLQFMSDGVKTQASAYVGSIASWLDHRMLAFAVGVVLSVLLRSTATVGIAMVLAGAGIPLVNLVPVVLGAALGTSATTFIASATGSRKGKQVAVAGFTIRLVIAAVFMPIVKPTAVFILWTTKLMTPGAGDVGVALRAVANVHMFTSLCAVLVVLPFVSPLATLVKRIVGSPHRIPAGALQYISFEEDVSAEEALTRAHKEVVRLVEITRDLVVRSVEGVRDNNERELERLEPADAKVDIVDEVLSEYLGRMKPAELTPEAREVKTKLLYIVKDLEGIADIATREITHIGWQKSRDNLVFSDDEKADLNGIVALVDEDMGVALETIRGNDTSEDLRAGVLEREREIDVQRMQVFDRQLARAASGRPGVEATTAACMSTINALRMIHFMIADMMRMVSGLPVDRAVPGRDNHRTTDA